MANVNSDEHPLVSPLKLPGIIARHHGGVNGQLQPRLAERREKSTQGTWPFPLAFARCPPALREYPRDHPSLMVSVQEVGASSMCPWESKAARKLSSPSGSLKVSVAHSQSPELHGTYHSTGIPGQRQSKRPPFPAKVAQTTEKRLAAPCQEPIVPQMGSLPPAKGRRGRIASSAGRETRFDLHCDIWRFGSTLIQRLDARTLRTTTCRRQKSKTCCCGPERTVLAGMVHGLLSDRHARDAIFG